MSLPGSGCCCGFIAGLILATLISVVMTIAVYCWVNPEARDKGITAVEKGWDGIKDFGDDVIKKTKKTEIPPPPELPSVDL